MISFDMSSSHLCFLLLGPGSGSRQDISGGPRHQQLPEPLRVLWGICRACKDRRRLQWHIQVQRAGSRRRRRWEPEPVVRAHSAAGAGCACLYTLYTHVVAKLSGSGRGRDPRQAHLQLRGPWLSGCDPVSAGSHHRRAHSPGSQSSSQGGGCGCTTAGTSCT